MVSQIGVSAKDVILEMLRRRGVQGGPGKIIQYYYGPGLECLSAMDRHVIANMGTELGATTTVFPSDGAVRQFLKTPGQGGESWVWIEAGDMAGSDETDEIDLSTLEPLIALPSSPGNVMPESRREVAGREGSFRLTSARPQTPACGISPCPPSWWMGPRCTNRVSFDVNPTSRQILENLAAMGLPQKLIASGARIHQAGCNGCIGMGQAPATGKISPSGPFPATLPAGPAQRRTKSICAARRPRPLRR